MVHCSASYAFAECNQILRRQMLETDISVASVKLQGVRILNLPDDQCLSPFEAPLEIPFY